MKHKLCSRTENINIFKMSTPPRAIPLKIAMMFFTELEQIMQKFMQNHKRPQIASAILRKKNGGVMLPDIRLYYKVLAINIAMYWHRNRQIDHWNRIESPETNPSLYSPLYLRNEAKTYNGLKVVYSINGVGKIGYMQKNATRSSSYTTYKNKLKMD